MKNIFLLVFFLTFTFSSALSLNSTKDSIVFDAGKKKIDVGVSENDAEIFLNGKQIGKGSALVTVPKDDCVTVLAKKIGYLTERIEFCNRKGMTEPPKTYFIEMRRDDAYDASIQTDIANVDIEMICNSMDKEQAWKLMNQIVLSYIDVIEMTDKDTGYLRTAWSLKTFMQNTIRTRIIIKETSIQPLIFKIKLVSEASGLPLTSVKSDELYKEWDRVLRSYSNVIGEFQARLK